MAYKQVSPITVVEGGTGVTTMTTAFAPVIAGTTATGALQVASTGLGTSGFVLTSTGAASLPTFQAAAAANVTTISGDSGSVTGTTITLTGGTSGAIFTGSSTTMTESFNFLALPTTTSANGQVLINGVPFLHSFNGTTNTFIGSNAGNFTLTSTNCTGVGTSTLAALTNGTGATAVGYQALMGCTSGVQNTGVGSGALLTLSTANSNSAVGYNALTLCNGADNVALGHLALATSAAGSQNTALGKSSMTALTSGTNNTAAGNLSLSAMLTGTQNIAIGDSAGIAYVGAESHNILLNNGGTAAESNVLRIGAGTGTGAQQLNSAFVCGIQGITVVGTAVLISTADQLGIAVSSARFKENIQYDGFDTSAVLKLRPVTFNYIVGDDRSLQTGLIAEEVQEILPALVIHDKQGLPQTVKYHDIPVLLLSELQKAVKRIAVLEEKLALKLNS